MCCLILLSEPISDQSDIECRVKALKEELRKRKLMAYQLKKEQKKRRKERLKAQEASLLKQLEVNVCMHMSMWCISKIHCIIVLLLLSFPFRAMTTSLRKLKQN